MAPMPAVLLRCDGGSGIGMGHLMRCRALAAAFAGLGWRHSFAVTRETAPLLADSNAIIVPPGVDGAHAVAEAGAANKVDCLVVDHYGLDAMFESAARGKASIVLVIDDLADRPHDCDLLVDPNPERVAADYAGLTGGTTRFLLGSQYALLRPEFADRHPAEARPPRRRAERLLITLGGADPDNVSQRLLEALPHLGGAPLKTVLVVGPANPHRETLAALAPAPSVEVAVDPPDLAGLMLDTDIAITAGSTSFWELACLGVPALIVVIADNQRAVARAAENAGAALVLGESNHLDPRNLAAAIAALAADPDRRQRMSESGRNLVDGRGAARVADAVAKINAAQPQEICS
jgi:UDP-2,4-diacetamido-2,4,6-trideoxy-beta-L-altropyranose hydrolase